jgi:hypothetical protein
MKKLAQRFNLSDAGLAKICKRHQVPRPGLGYWAKKAYGKRVVKDELPEVSEQSLRTIHIVHGVELSGDEAKQCYFVDDLQKLAAGEKDPANAITVSFALHSPHPIVHKTREELNKEKADSNGVVSSGGDDTLRIQVAKANIGRALRLLDALIRACEHRGFQIKKPSVRYKAGLCIVWGSHELDFRIREKLERHDHQLTEKERRGQSDHWFSRPPKWDFSLSGRLELEIQGVTVQDGKTLRVEDQLNKLMLRVYRRLDDWERSRAEWKRVEEERRIQQEARIEKERRQKQREQRRKKLLGEVEAWHHSQLIRLYVREVLPYDGDGLGNSWAKWALREADAMDPRQRRISSCLENGRSPK